MYNIKAISKILDMPAVTIRSWETRYQVVTPKRTQSGHRIYTEDQLNDLKWIKKQVQEKGMNISQAAKLLNAKRKSEESPSIAPSGLTFETQVEELYEAVLELNPEKCEYLLDLYFSQFHYKSVFYHIIVPLMYKVGAAWERGELHVAKEHMISNLVFKRSVYFFNLFHTSLNLPKVMAICPEGERHQLGLLLFSLFLREQHYPVYYIGADTPLDGLGELIREKDIEIVAISTSRPTDEENISHYISTLSKQNPNLKFIVGGLGIQQSHSTTRRWNIAPSDSNWLQTLSQMLN